MPWTCRHAFRCGLRASPSHVKSNHGGRSSACEGAPALTQWYGWLYWAETDTQRAMDVIRRSNLDGSDVQTIYAAPVGRQIRDLALDAFAAKLYWRDPSQNRLLWITAEGGGEATVLRNVGSVA